MPRVKTPKIYRPSEDEELIRFFDWVSFAKYQDPRLEAVFHVPNERRTSYFMGKRNKRKGVKAGVSDVIGLIPEGHYHGFAFELKRKPNKVSPAQLAFLQLLRSLGFKVAVAWSADELISMVKEYLGKKDLIVPTADRDRRNTPR